MVLMLLIIIILIVINVKAKANNTVLPDEQSHPSGTNKELNGFDLDEKFPEGQVKFP